MFTLATFLAALKHIPAAVAAKDDVKDLIDAARRMLANKDQATAKEAYADLVEDNDEGFARLDAKLEAAKNR